MSCYAARSLALPHIRRATLHVLLHFLPHIRHATLLHVLLHFHTYVIVMLCCSMFSWTSTHTSCYEPEQLAMLMVAKLGKGPRDNKCQKNASNGKTLPTTAVSLWSTWAESPQKKSSSLAGTQTLDRQWGKKMEVLVCCSLAQERKRQCPEQLCDWKENRNFSAKPSTPRRTKLLFCACKTLDFPLLKWPFQGICTRNIYIWNKCLQFRTLPSSSWHCVMSSPTRPPTDAVTMFLSRYSYMSYMCVIIQRF